MATTLSRAPGARVHVRSLGLRSAVAAAVLLFLVLTGVVAPVAPAAAADFVFKGRGYGHGVGMSQWGAWQAAKEGKDFRFILSFYYPGSTLEPLADPGLELKVKLSSEPWKSVSTISQNFTVVDVHPVGDPLTLVAHGAGGDTTVELASGTFATLQPKGGAVELVTAATGRLGPFSWVEARPATGGRTKVQFRTAGTLVAPREYWGTMRIEPSPTAGNLVVFNLVPIERYLRSIGEVEYDWAQPSQPAYAPEAVKAQAVAARTYAIANKDPYLNDNQWDQVYLGYTGRAAPGETPFEQRYPGIPQAAEQTAGLVLRYNGQVISSFFSSSSGGYTTAWDPGRYPYLPAKADPYSLKAPLENPGYVWSFTISQEDLSADVDGLKDTAGATIHLGTIQRIEVASRDTSDPGSHAATMRLIGGSGTALVKASEFRRLFGYSQMRSTLFTEIVSPGGATPPPPADGFSDVPPGHLYHDEIMRAVEEGLVGGYASGEFRPENTVSRWQFAKMAVGLHNALFPQSPIPVVDVATQPFWDVAARPGVLGDESDWVSAAQKAGLMEGVTPTNFKPYEPVQRDQMASVLVRAMEWDDEAAALTPDAPGFADVAAASPHRAAAAYLRSRGVLQGYEEPPGSGVFYLKPADPTKRMHAAVILCRVLDAGL